jgi:hypothetical protein
MVKAFCTSINRNQAIHTKVQSQQSSQKPTQGGTMASYQIEICKSNKGLLSLPVIEGIIANKEGV